MGHEAIAYGRIVGASWRVGDRFTWIHELNQTELNSVPVKDNWPWVVRGIFALPAPHPEGTYRRQIIHFGLSMKDDPGNRGIWDVWLEKFERVLRRLYWVSAVVHIETDFEPPWMIEWVPTESARDRLYDDPPQPITEWVRTSRSFD